ncbi:50S ribosomal protein L11 methyltransferase [Texcoconibacillus texcoconensis]|uniref:Ribosomal protein L11 methyltransferase n=1 Tax=Texcoconibacillus texcoconensis TaxID=1095777 RepID=A0A840QQP5_9BACI|nr:50S ribosomal protein L11 methyltransferase [Texcoconibacillus texcoconensis]MBB5173651.1 ribosomal protein L11 methyltransferase [Texcoconibacillus texcoconensis]
MEIYQIPVTYEALNESLEVLTAVGYENWYYDIPVENERIENGYKTRTLPQENAFIHVVIQEKSDFDHVKKLSETLNVSPTHIQMNEFNQDHMWQEPFPDVQLDGGWVISFDTEQNVERDKIIILDSQGAFGTGLHETTQDCVNTILSDDFTKQTVLDLGCGSGILSVAALLKEAEYVEAVDIQPVEREVKRHAQLNHVENVKVLQRDAVNEKNLWDGEFDWVFINIGAEEAVTLLNNHPQLLQVKNFLISGVVEWNVEYIHSFFKDAGYSIDQQMQTNEWVTVTYRK